MDEWCLVPALHNVNRWAGFSTPWSPPPTPNHHRYTDKGQLLEPKLVVYECNELCRCHLEGCKNRVVGKGLQLRLEVFRCVATPRMPV